MPGHSRATKYPAGAVTFDCHRISRYGLRLVVMLAILIALSGSLSFALSMILANRGTLSIDYFRGLLINLAFNALFLWLYLLLFADKIEIWIPGNVIFFGVGIFVPGIARLFIFKGLERLNASVSSCLTNSAPLFAIFFAVVFLAERPTVTNILGAISIVGGMVTLSWRGVTKTWRTRDLLFPASAAFLFAARDNFVRFGVQQIHSPITGAAIAATTSLVTMALAYVGFEEKKPLSKLAKRGFNCFALAGFMNFLSYAFTYTALGMKRVSIISPLVNCSSLFVLPLSYFMLKDVERMTSRKIGATLLVILGVFLISWEKM